MVPETPDGYVGFVVGQSRVVCMPHVADAMRRALRTGTLHGFAAAHPARRPLAGRGVAYAVPLPGDVEQVVVRHNRHGGLLAPVTGDLFRLPTRAPLELAVSNRLRAEGVATPCLLGYVLYPAGALFGRVDVMTREITPSRDLSAALLSDDAAERIRALDAAAALLGALTVARARHHDLNVKNILLVEHEPPNLRAAVLDVDRVTFEKSPGAVHGANLARLLRSARKWQTRHGARVTAGELEQFAAAARSSGI